MMPAVIFHSYIRESLLEDLAAPVRKLPVEQVKV